MYRRAEKFRYFRGWLKLAKFSRRTFSRYRLPIPYSANILLYTYFRFRSAKIKTLPDPDCPLANTIKPEVMIEQRKREKTHNHR